MKSVSLKSRAPTRPLARLGRARRLAAFSIAGLLGVIGLPAGAQSFCASDGQPRVTGLLERFIDADCADCWRDARTARPRRAELALDWVLPGQLGDEAPLAAVAQRETVERLASLNLLPPTGQGQHRTRIQALKAGPATPPAPSAHSTPPTTPYTLRAAHGVAFNGYMGTSLELQADPSSPRARGSSTPAGPWTGWLAMVETLPAGTEGSPVQRNLVRNVLRIDWTTPTARAPEATPGATNDPALESTFSEPGAGRASRQPTTPAAPLPQRWFEARSMSVPVGANPARISLVGWVEDRRGQILVAVQSRCAP